MRGDPVRFADFSGGVNTKAAPYLVAENEARDARNVVSTTRGSIKKRNGNTTFCSTFGGSPANLMSLFAMQATTVLIATGAAKIYSVSTGGTATDITGGTAITSGLRWEFVEAPASGGQGPLWGMNGTDIPKYWTGAGNTADWTAASGTLPVGKYCLFFKNRVWAAGTSGNPSRLFWSDVGDPRAWPAANVVDLDPSDGDAITGLGTIGPYLLVFKRGKTFVIYDLDTGANRVLSATTGCVAHRSITETPGGTYFLTADKGVYVTNGLKMEQVSEQITPTLDTIVGAQRQNAAGTFFNDHYYLSVCTTGSTTNNITLDYDTQLGAWWFHTNNVNQFARWRPTAGLELYAVQSGSAVLDKSYVSGTLQDNGANFTAYWIGPWLTVSGTSRGKAVSAPYVKKRIRQIHVDGTGVIDAYISLDFASTGTLILADIFALAGSGTLFGGTGLFGGVGIFGDIPGQSAKRLPTLGVARAFSFQIQATTNAVLEMDAYTPYLTTRTN